MGNRILKESICRSDEIDALSWFEEVLFYRLIVNCDDYGRFDGREKVIKSYCFPLKDIRDSELQKALQKLTDVGLVRRYQVKGKPVLRLTTWERHQQIRAQKAKYPGEDEADAVDIGCNQMISDDITCVSNPIQSESNPNKNPNPREVSRERSRFTPPTVEEVKEYCEERKNGVDPERFVDFYASKGWRVGKDPMKDWKACVRTWEKRDTRAAPQPSAYMQAIHDRVDVVDSWVGGTE